MESYARNDTHHLKPLADKLKAELKQKGRLAWHEESCARLIADCTQLEPEDQDAVWRVKGSHALSRAALAVLRELWHWREVEAVAANRPPYFILQHEKVVDIAIAATEGRPVDPLLPRHFSERRLTGLRRAMNTGLELAADKHPEIPRRHSHRPSEAERRRYDELEQRRNARAKALDLDPTLIASRATLSALAHDWTGHLPELMRWQQELLKS